MKASELTEQIKLMSWARSIESFVPELALLHHIPNEGKRTNGGVLKAAGLKTGIPDLCLPIPRKGYHGLYIEMKYGKNKLSKNQKEMIAKIEKEQYKVSVCYSAKQAREVIRHYLARAAGFDLVNCEEAVKMFKKCEGIQVDWSPCNKCKYYTKNK